MSLCADDRCSCAFQAGSAVSYAGSAEPGDPLLVSTHYGIWTPTTPEFMSGVVLGGASLTGNWRVRRTGTNESELDYSGRLTLDTDSQITGAVFLRIPGGLTADPFAVQHRAQTIYVDGSTSYVGWWSTQADDDTMISFRITSGGHLGATSPFTWGNNDYIRWDIRGLLVQA